jgi:hypothetical protein
VRYALNPRRPLMAQLRTMGIPEHLPVEQAMVYRFFNGRNDLLYLGVTISPRGRWQAHKASAPWWSDVRWVSIKLYPHERSALDAEVVAIKTERPPFNKRSAAHAKLTPSSCAPHESRMHSSRAILPRVGGGGGVGVRGGVFMAKALCILTVSSEPAWLPRRPATLAGPMQDKR